MINGIFDDFWKFTHLSLTHWGRVTHYGDGSMLCKNPIFFTMKEFHKFKMLWFFESIHHHLLESIAKIAHFYILTLPGGVTLTKKKKSLFQRLWGENGHNSINITASALKLL